MPFDIPLPRSDADIPGGRLFNNMNAVRQAALSQRKQELENQYYGQVQGANALSKMAYANLMGPQFMAKLMEHPDIAANLSPEQLKNALAVTYQAGTGQGTGNGLANQLANMPSSNATQQPSNSLIDIAKNAIARYFGGGEAVPSAPANAMLATQPHQMPAASSAQNQLTPHSNEGMAYDQNGNNIKATPEEVAAKVSQISNADQGMPRGTYAENAANYAGIKKEGEKLGEIRAQAIGDLDEQYQQAVQAEVPVQHLIDISQSPAFMAMREKIPLFQDKQLQTLAKLGTPEQQKMIGDFIATTSNAVANTVTSFGGRVLAKEFDIANQMKISPNDTWNAMIGKLESIKTFNEMTKQRSRLASEYMQDAHVNRGKALEWADKRIDGEAIRKKVGAELNTQTARSQPNDLDIKHMAEKYNISPEEVKKRLAHKGYKMEFKSAGEK